MHSGIGRSKEQVAVLAMGRNVMTRILGALLGALFAMPGARAAGVRGRVSVPRAGHSARLQRCAT